MDIKEILKLYKSSMQSELRLIGIESEYPIINNKDFCSCTKKGLKNIFEDFVFQGWAPQYDSQTKKISAVSKKTGNKIKITSDMGVGILEINYAPKENLLEVQKEMEEQIKIISDIISNKNLIMLGYGIQPVSIPGRELVAEKGYYRTLERKFWTTKNSSLVTKNSTDIHYHTISASSQVHISVKNEKEAINVLNNLNIISPIIISLMANSSVWLRGKNIKYNEPRQIFWDWAINTPKDKYRKGIPKKRFRDLEDYIDTQLSFEPIITTRIKDGNIKYFEVVGSQTLRECFQKNQVLITSPGNFNRKLYDKTKNY